MSESLLSAGLSIPAATGALAGAAARPFVTLHEHGFKRSTASEGAALVIDMTAASVTLACALEARSHTLHRLVELMIEAMPETTCGERFASVLLPLAEELHLLAQALAEKLDDQAGVASTITAAERGVL
jgi:hypothetical protein